MRTTRACAATARRVVAVAAALALVGGTASASRPVVVREPVYRYYVIARTDDKPHAIRATVHSTYDSIESENMGWVVQNARGRQDVFDYGAMGPYQWATASAGGVGAPRCNVTVVCDYPATGRQTLSVAFPVWFDYFFVLRDARITSVDFSQSPDKNWVFKELTGDPRRTGTVHVRYPEDGDVTSVSVYAAAVQHVKELSYPGGRYGSIATARTATSFFNGVGHVGEATLDGGRKYVQDIRTVDGEVPYVAASAPRATTWRLHGDLVTVGWAASPLLVVYDLPDPAELRKVFGRWVLRRQ